MPFATQAGGTWWLCAIVGQATKVFPALPDVDTMTYHDAVPTLERARHTVADLLGLDRPG